MMILCLPIFVAATKNIFAYNFVAALSTFSGGQRPI